MQDAHRYKQEEAIPWTVLADDLQGTAHQVYGGLADPVYLIDTDGRVAFYNMWTHAPTLHEALETLVRHGSRGQVETGIDSLPHLLPSMTDGWRALKRGLPQSFLDLETAAPGVASSTWLGYQLRPLTSALTLRGTPLPGSAKIGLAIVANGPAYPQAAPLEPQAIAYIAMVADIGMKDALTSSLAGKRTILNSL